MSVTTGRPPFQVDVSGWEIPLRYHMGWTIVFDVATESFACPILCLFKFSNVKDLEKAIERSLQYRGQIGGGS